MLKCEGCGRTAQMTYQEVLANCPYCASDSWHIFHILPGFMPTHNARAMKEIRESTVPPRGRCILTPKGKMIPIGLLRGGGEEDDKAARDKGKAKGKLGSAPKPSSSSTEGGGGH